jgi:hypothetical protein
MALGDFFSFLVFSAPIGYSSNYMEHLLMAPTSQMYPNL